MIQRYGQREVLCARVPRVNFRPASGRRIRRLVFLPIAVAVLAWSAATPSYGQSQERGQGSAFRRCAKVRILAEDGSGELKWIRRGASASEILDLVFIIRLNRKSVEGASLLELELFTPNGNLYQILSEPITADPAAEGKSVMVDGYPKAKKQQALVADELDSNRLVAKIPFPVAGTLIVSNSLYGRWTARVKVDGETVSCPEMLPFNILP